MEKTYLSIQTSLSVTILIGLFFIGLGYLNSKKISNNKNYIVGDRDENTFSLTASLTASALGAWILFGPASAATWGGIGSVIGYSLGTAFPMLALIYLGKKRIITTISEDINEKLQLIHKIFESYFLQDGIMFYCKWTGVKK